MHGRSTKRSGFLRASVGARDAIAIGDPREPAALRRVDAPAPRGAEPGPRSSLEELFRTLVHEELRPFVHMLHDLLERLGRAAHASDEFLSVAKAAEIAQVGESTLRAWIKSGRLRAGRAGRLVRIRRADLSALITDSRQEKRLDPEAEAAKILERNRSRER